MLKKLCKVFLDAIASLDLGYESEWVSQRESLSQIIDTLIIEHWMSIEYTLNKYKNIAKHGAIKDIVRCYRI